jgi:acyl-coenzyme A synthetase/AMP-(fatty) acid ligase
MGPSIVQTPYEALAARAASSAPMLVAPASAELAYAPEGFRHTYGEVFAEVEALRQRYAARGYGCGSTVALMLENRADFFRHWLALNSLGVSILPLNSELGADDLGYQLALVGPDLVVALAAWHGKLRAAGAAAARVVAPDGDPPACGVAVSRQHGEPPDACALLFTSGTTARPKCCVLSNDYFLRIARWYVAQSGIATMRDGDVVLTPLPMFHMNALACSTLGMMLTGGAIVPLDRFHARRWWRTVADAGATVIHYLGVMPAILLKLDEAAVDRGHQVRFGFGAGVDPRHQQIFEQRFGFPLIEGWAMTETGGGAVTSTAGGPRHVGERCIGRKTAHMAHRIVDETGADAPAGAPGELLVRARGEDPRRGFFSGYLNDESATREAWAGGWFHTGDVVREGPDGSLFFVDRKKNIVRRSGENISVVEVEGVLESLDAVAGAAVAPVADEIRGEEVFALIRLACPPDPAAATALAHDIARACAARLAYFKTPAYIAFVAALPVTATQKLQRGATRTMAAQALGAPGTIDLRDFKARLREPSHRDPAT